MGLENFITTYEVSEGTLEDLLIKAKSNGVTIDRGQYNSSKNLLKTYVKAFIARNIWENDGFYPVLNEQDEIVQTAKSLIAKAKELDQ